MPSIHEVPIFKGYNILFQLEGVTALNMLDYYERAPLVLIYAEVDTRIKNKRDAEIENDRQKKLKK